MRRDKSHEHGMKIQGQATGVKPRRLPAGNHRAHGRQRLAWIVLGVLAAPGPGLLPVGASHPVWADTSPATEAGTPASETTAGEPVAGEPTDTESSNADGFDLALGGPNDFADLSLEELMSIEVTSVSGVAQEWFKLHAFELGYRVKATRNLTLDLATFYNDYNDLSVPINQGLVGRFQNDGSGESYGGELAATWEVAPSWRVVASYSFVDVHVRGSDSTALLFDSPHHTFQAASYLDITKDLELNTAVYYVDNLSTIGVDSYVRLDLGMT